MMSKVKNILFIMCDQLRWDYLSCYGHPTLNTPNIDWLASQGVRFNKAYVQSASCGPSRMSYYTGRYVQSHRSFGNFVPLPLDERTLGDYLRPLGMRVAVNGKSHAEADIASLRMRGIDPQSTAGILASQAGFEPFDRHDGVLVDGAKEELESNQYTRYLKSHGYAGNNPWLTYANSGQDSAGNVLPGWSMQFAKHEARVPEKHSETAYTTQRAIDFMTEEGDSPWCLHLSYIKPHWPYVAPSPYNDMYGASDVIGAVRHPDEKIDSHPILASYHKHDASVSFSDEKVRETVIPVYMGLVKQVDDQLGTLFEFMRKQNLWENTMVVFCSDHGDYLGDHFLGEKELFHDTVNRVPMIIYDPSDEASSTRGTANDSHFVESIDLLPTFIEAVDAKVNTERVEGLSLIPLLHGKKPQAWRQFVVGEFDYSFRAKTRIELNKSIKQCSMITLRDDQWKFVHSEGFRPMLFNLIDDPHEFKDLGQSKLHKEIIDTYALKLSNWLLERKRYTTANDIYIRDWLHDDRFSGMQIGVW
jgi:arylsulfatase A-like enzyme